MPIYEVAPNFTASQSLSKRHSIYWVVDRSNGRAHTAALHLSDSSINHFRSSIDSWSLAAGGHTANEMDGFLYHFSCLLLLPTENVVYIFTSACKDWATTRHHIFSYYQESRLASRSTANQ